MGKNIQMDGSPGHLGCHDSRVEVRLSLPGMGNELVASMPRTASSSKFSQVVDTFKAPPYYLIDSEPVVVSRSASPQLVRSPKQTLHRDVSAVSTLRQISAVSSPRSFINSL